MDVSNTAGVLYHGCDVEAMREAGGVASHARMPSSPGFTPINQNQSHLQLTSPLQSSAYCQTQQSQTKARTSGRSNRRRNPTVASYLGLGDPTEPAQLVKYAPAPNGRPLSRSGRKRRVQDHGEHANPGKRTNKESKSTPKQGCLSGDLHITKHTSQPTVRRSDGLGSEEYLPTPPASLTKYEATTTPATQRPRTVQQEHVRRDTTVKSVNASSTETSYTNDAVPQHTNNDFDELCFDFEANPPTFDDAAQPAQEFGTDLNVDEDEFDNDLVDEDLLEMLDNAVDTLDSPNFQPGSPSEAIDVEKPSHTAASPDLSSDNLTASDDGMNSSGFASRKFVSPVMAKTRLLAAIGDEDRKPIVRPDFPCSVRDRSPIIGLSATTLLRTCFRIGEAVSQSCHAVKIGNNVLIELYARVLNSERDDKQQRFTLCDLFHTKPPYLEALYASTIWKPVELFDYDSARLLQQGKICRCIGTMKRDGKNWIMTVLNVWEATWDDVAWVEGIINS